ncbi:hypothetical protein CK501_15645 [Halovibrio salipaludis]|uniref:WD40-like Beta Propeller Repeat n=1 Tax=Halovibrio salipaludis TaxID=2032626 RepID=A0A2A2EWF2_9GAMM|nr:PD40 domain-containing protein [Halovibrio salipaludis]PAU76998.1 hypothetical protein CK501_15645 [Halovibrio salipaludis]
MFFRRPGLASAFVFSFMVSVSSGYAEECAGIPTGASFMGHSGEGWKLFHSGNGESWEVIETALEPRGYSYHSENNLLVYVGIDGAIYYRHGDSGEEEVDTPSEDAAYTQPDISPDGARVYLVEMKNRNSRETDIVSWSVQEDRFETVLSQRSAQFEPYVTQESVFYSNVLCVESCGRIIQEIWRKDAVSGVGEQLTLMNHIAKQPVLSRDGKRLYFSSNRKGHYKIWVYDMEQGKASQFTQGEAVDLYPMVGKGGGVFFIRRTDGQVKLMCQSAEEASPEAIPLPESVTDLRELEASG